MTKVQGEGKSADMTYLAINFKNDYDNLCIPYRQKRHQHDKDYNVT